MAIHAVDDGGTSKKGKAVAKNSGDNLEPALKLAEQIYYLHDNKFIPLEPHQLQKFLDPRMSEVQHGGTNGANEELVVQNLQVTHEFHHGDNAVFRANGRFAVDNGHLSRHNEVRHVNAAEGLYVPSARDDEQPLPVQRETHSFAISSEVDVERYYIEKSCLLQQNRCKRLAKALIKGVYPRKQARHPYYNKQQRDGTVQKLEIPEWWPPVEMCRYIEPDHITKEERVRLLIHLLRLRPTAEKLREWREDDDLHPTMVNEGWTAFLKEQTDTPSLFEGLPEESKEKKKERNMYLDQLYDVAAKEEQYQADEIDANTMISWTPSQDVKRQIEILHKVIKTHKATKTPKGGKRSHKSTDSDDEDYKPVDAEGNRRSKRVKPQQRMQTQVNLPPKAVSVARADSVVASDDGASTIADTVFDDSRSFHDPSRVPSPAMTMPMQDMKLPLYTHPAAVTPSDALQYNLARFRGMDEGLDLLADWTPNSSFHSTTSAHEGIRDPYQSAAGPSNFRGTPNHTFGGNNFPVYSATGVPTIRAIPTPTALPETLNPYMSVLNQRHDQDAPMGGFTTYGQPVPQFDLMLRNQYHDTAPQPQFDMKMPAPQGYYNVGPESHVLDMKHPGPRGHYNVKPDSRITMTIHGVPRPPARPNHNDGYQVGYPEHTPDLNTPPPPPVHNAGYQGGHPEHAPNINTPAPPPNHNDGYQQGGYPVGMTARGPPPPPPSPNDGYPQGGYPEHRSEPDTPPDALPSPVIRGYTGHSSGVGDGAGV